MDLPSVKEEAGYVCAGGLMSGYIEEVSREMNVCICMWRAKGGEPAMKARIGLRKECQVQSHTWTNEQLRL